MAADESLLQACEGLMQQMMDHGDEVVTILEGEEANPEITAHLVAWMEERYPDAEIEVHPGGQPVYYYLFSVEA
ncbi:hypothetical protein D3C75_1202900 [compost metagenome]